MPTLIDAFRGGRPRRRPALLVVVALLVGAALVLAADAAGAHASVRATTPSDGQRLAPGEVPGQVTIEFNEDVTTAPDAVRVFDESGDRVDVDAPVEDEDPDVVGRALGDLDDGGYVVTWAVTSADGHPLRGAFVFTVGDGPAVDDALVATVFGGGAGVVGPAQVAVVWVTYVAVFLAAGAVLTALALRWREALPGWVRTVALVAVGSTVLVLPLQAAAASVDGLDGALDPAALGAVLTGSVGLAALVRLVGLGLLVVGPGGTRALGAAVALASFLVDGHTRTVEPAWVMLVGDAAHVLAGAVWVGGLALLLARLRARRLGDDPVGGATLVRDWSRVATVAVVGVVLAGAALSWATVRTPDALGTAYATTLLVKVALALLVVGLGAYNHLRVVPAVQRAVTVVPAGAAAADETATAVADGAGPTAVARTEAGWQRLRATVRLEVVVIVAVLAVSAWLQGQRPAVDELGIGGTFVATEQLTDELALDVVVDPNVAGVNTIHFYLLDDTGRTASAEGVDVLMSQPAREIGPIEREAQVAGPGHWTITGSELALPGTWELEAVVRLDPFTERRVTVRTVVGAP